MTSTQTLLYAASSDVTLDRVRALVQQVGPESPTVEYKEKLTDTLARGVAALANTYGGVMLVGVTDNRKIVGVKESVIASVAEHCAAKIEPSYVPDMIPVPLDDGSGLLVLVLRVIPGHHVRPLLVDSIAYVRHQNTTHAADWRRLADLFAEGAASPQDDAGWNVRRPDLPTARDHGGTDTDVDFVVRSGFNIDIAREAKWRPLSERSVVELAEALDRSPFSDVLSRIAAPTGDLGIYKYHRSGLNRARTVRLEWSAAPTSLPAEVPRPAGACASLEIPGEYGNHSTQLSIQLDGLVQVSATRLHALQPTDSPVERWRITVLQLRDLFDAVMATLTSDDVVRPIASMAGLDVTAVPQPRVMHFITPRPIVEVLSMDGLRPIQAAGVSHGAHLIGDPALDMSDAGDRAAQVRIWLAQAGLDAGFLGMEQLIDRL